MKPSSVLCIGGLKTVIFRDFGFNAQHCLPSKKGAASLPHWHTYRVRLWFLAVHDQDQLGKWIEAAYGCFRSADLNQLIPEAETTDEGLAGIFLLMAQRQKCIRVQITTDGVRGAEVEQ